MKHSRKAVRPLTIMLVAICGGIPLCQGGTITGLGTATNYGFLALPGSQVTMNAFTINRNVGLASGVTFTGANPNVISGDIYEGSSDGGLNVIDINGDITKGVTLNGTANDIFVVLVHGNLNLTTGDLGVSGGVSASNVLYIFTDPGDKINTMVPDKLYGTILAPNYNISMDSDLTGELIGGGTGDKITLYVSPEHYSAAL